MGLLTRIFVVSDAPVPKMSSGLPFALHYYPLDPTIFIVSGVRTSTLINNYIMDNFGACPICEGSLTTGKAGIFLEPLAHLFSLILSPRLKVKLSDGKNWMTFLSVWKETEALYCANCGALVLAPSNKKHLKKIDEKDSTVS